MVPTIRHGAGASVASKRFQEIEIVKMRRTFLCFRETALRYFLSLIYDRLNWTPFQCQQMELKRKWEEDRATVEKLKASRRSKPHCMQVSYSHFHARVAFSFLLPTLKKHNSQIRCTYTSPFKLAASEVWFGNQKFSSTLSGSFRRYSKTVNGEADSNVNTNQGSFFIPNPQTNLKGSDWEYQSDRTSK